ncbi:hypothetical protein [Alkalibacterium sp. MB6]|uniref:hypothetical protein n=1 Tax=Alkalibacterium sp. MB6 TaxID=2081965 RepID=UPI001379B669|nr:hypothetical protein [Alkalibacterium sp. MB6]
MVSKWLSATSILIALLISVGCSDQEVEGSPDIDKVDTEDAMITPPHLIVHIGEETVTAEVGAYSWTVDLGDGNYVTTVVDAAGPHDIVKMIEPTPVDGDANVSLEFEEEPLSYTVKIWDEYGNVTSESQEIELPDQGEVIYEVLASWESDTVSYAILLSVE